MSAMKKLSLRQTFFINALFEGQDVPFWDFTGSQLTGASFARANCTQTVFEKSTLVNVDFSESILMSVKFAYVGLYGATFYQTKPVKFIFDHVKLEKVNSTGVMFHGGFQKPANTRFRESNIAYSTFANVVLFNIRFELCNVTGADFTNSYLLKSEF
ncbi:unnamed protein product [Rotaria socialis]|uniref:Pentapeptide repeat-containing protein n=1 Tax=Rotaria socialis TaxID=392032 RepID=A0A817UFY1_9BILA|nr:unnamed protein product [Rotaria socialis]CAF3382734.1 unnamed protein product [Rotaria socialis]CAF3442101.1 unnamed protein product [Rotaria socialis]CAF4325683.1 unnamed protein product [Rotaria socialis]CAF4351652.1 unnamed protein product [Rotaria socialis]